MERRPGPAVCFPFTPRHHRHRAPANSYELDDEPSRGCAAESFPISESGGPMAKIVVVGGGMAGVACALELGRKDIDVVVVDRHDYLQFQPLLYQVASSQLPAEDVARPLKVVFEDRPSVSVVQMDVH